MVAFPDSWFHNVITIYAALLMHVNLTIESFPVRQVFVEIDFKRGS